MSASQTVQFVDLQAAYKELEQPLQAALLGVAASGGYIGGGEVDAFEQEFAAYTGARHAIGVANGTDAIELVLRALDLPAGSEALIPANTFVATAEAVAAAGLVARFVDVHADTGLIDVEDCRSRMTDAVRVVIPVHLYGRLVPMDEVLAFAAEHDLVVLEDSAQAHGARRDGKHAGTFGIAGTFSFYPGKNLGAIGDGGAIVTDDDGLAERVRVLRDHGRQGDDHMSPYARNSRLDALQAAALRVKLGPLDEWNDRRREIARQYREALPAELLDWTGADDAGEESHHLFPILVDDPSALAAALREEGIPTGAHYRRTVSSTTAFGGVTGEFPRAEDRAERQLSLPIHPHLTEEQVSRITELVARHAVASGVR